MDHHTRERVADTMRTYFRAVCYVAGKLVFSDTITRPLKTAQECRDHILEPHGYPAHRCALTSSANGTLTYVMTDAVSGIPLGYYQKEERESL